MDNKKLQVRNLVGFQISMCYDATRKTIPVYKLFIMNKLDEYPSMGGLSLANEAIKQVSTEIPSRIAEGFKDLV